jgi:hypothetical protein
MHSVPELIDRSKGAFLDSEWFNKQSENIYADLLYLVDRDMELYAKTKIMAEVAEAANIGYVKAANESLNEPSISYKSMFYFPTDKPACIVDSLYGEITLPISSDEQQLTTVSGKIRDTIAVSRSSDNFIFSSKPESISESRILDAIENSQYPYMVRVRGVSDTIKVKLIATSEFGAITNNVIEFVPAPYIGCTAFEYILVRSTDRIVSTPTDLEGKEIKTLEVPRNLRYRPIRLHVTEADRSSITIGYEGLSRLESSNISLAGVYSFKASRRIWNPKGYIGFKIPFQQGKSLVGITPVLKWCNTYKASIKFKVYDSLESMMEVGTNELTSFNENGIGMPYSMTSDLYVVAEIQSLLNGSPQIIGFDYSAAVI